MTNIAVAFAEDFENNEKIVALPSKGKKIRKKGDSNMVYPLKDKEMLGRFLNIFEDEFKNATTDRARRTAACNRAYVFLSINSGLRNSDVITRKWCDIYNPDWTFRRDGVRIREQKTSKYAPFRINNETRRVIEEYRAVLGEVDYKDYVFKTRQSKKINDDVPEEKKHICRANCEAFLQKAAEQVGFDRNFGTHSLRKTFGYHFLQNHKNDIYALATLQKLFRHSSPAITLAYVGIDEDTTAKLYDEMGSFFEEVM